MQLLEQSDRVALQPAPSRWPDPAAGLLESCRQYLLLIANEELNPRLAQKAGASDLVQDTLLLAQENLGGFRGKSQAELLAWLRKILINHMASMRRQYLESQKRAVDREVSLDALLGSGSGGLAATTATPSSHCMQIELAEAIEAALQRLPEMHRVVIRLRYRERLAFQEIAQRLEVSEQAARQIWVRAIGRLRRELRGLE